MLINIMWDKQNKKGFTIVELFIVIVVIGILAAITIVAFNGIQARGKDAERTSDLASIQKALDLYFIDNDGYPLCGSASPYVLGTGATGGEAAACLTAGLVPKYIPSIPKDPKNSGSFLYWYAYGYKKTGAATYDTNKSNNYIIGGKLESKGCPYNPGWTSKNDLNYLEGSSN